MIRNLEQFKNFLIKAKTSSYANSDDRVFLQSPLPDSKLLEFKEGNFTYRDIYFGSMQFAGQETVSLNDKVIWTMNYTGQSQTDENLVAIYDFLCKALLQISVTSPFRGPTELSGESGFYYKNKFKGDIDFFHGEETIMQNDVIIYRLYYSGGWVS